MEDLLMKTINKSFCAIALFIIATTLIGCSSVYKQSDVQDSKPTVELKNSYWKLLNIQGKPVIGIEGERELFLQLRADSLSLKGFAGCNSIMGSYTLDADTLTFSKVASTRKYCASAMDQEQSYIKALALVVNFKIIGKYLFFYDSNEQQVLELVSVDQK